MEKLWAPVRAACLFSATLYVPDVRGLPSANYMRWVLGIPKGRDQQAAPVETRWIYETPLLITPSGTNAQAAPTPPSCPRNKNQAIEDEVADAAYQFPGGRWLGSLAAAIGTAAAPWCCARPTPQSEVSPSG